MPQHDWNTIESRIRKILEADRAHPMLIDSFLRNARLVHSGTTGLISRNDIDSVRELPEYESLSEVDRAVGQKALSQTVMIKLNGGLGTSMGLERAKSLLPVKRGLSFLDIIAGQILKIRTDLNIHLPLLFMTSYRTDADTLSALGKYPSLSSGQPDIPLTFPQNRVPKLLANTLLPAECLSDPEKAWCPPGHGDIFTALVTSGLLDTLILNHYRYAFISNADNLGAVIDPSIVGIMANQKIPFLIEVTERTEADKKGGHLAMAKQTGQLLLRESAQCPDDEKAEFQDITRYRFFNTNNIWVDLSALQDVIKNTGSVPALSLMVNRKLMDPRDQTSPQVLQLETAMGSAVASFKGATALNVPRTRFAPVKTTDDLLALWSDAYELTEDMHIRLSPKRILSGPPVIKLDPRFYQNIDDFILRFPEGAPSLMECQKMTVEGNHIFHGLFSISGDAHFMNASAEPAHIFNQNDSEQNTLSGG